MYNWFVLKEQGFYGLVIQGLEKIKVAKKMHPTKYDEKIEIGSEKKDPVAKQYSKTIANKLYIVFNGKNFGPYDFVGKNYRG